MQADQNPLPEQPHSPREGRTDSPVRPSAVPEEPRAAADELHDEAAACMAAGQWEKATSLLRRAIALYPCPTFSSNLINCLARTGAPSVLSDYCDAPGAVPAPRLFIAAQPKSGSTFLKNILATLTGWRDVYFCHHTEMTAQDLFFPSLLEFLTTPTVTHQHVRATEANLQLMQAFGLSPVVLTRDPADVTVSLRDFLTAGAVRGTSLDVDAWMQAAPEPRADIIIDHILPWHSDFLRGWQRAAAARRVPVHWLTYEQLIRDPAAAVSSILSFHGLSVPEPQIAAAIAEAAAAPARNRFQTGTTGRGQTELTAAQRDRIRCLFSPPGAASGMPPTTASESSSSAAN